MTLKAAAKNGWRVREGVLANVEPGNDLMTEKKFTDFKLHAEFRYPAGSNSGIYLRGRHEVQIEDDFGQAPESHGIGGVYGFLTPRINAGKKAGEWQAIDITLVGRILTVVLNGERVIENAVLPGVPARGPIGLQHEDGPVQFSNLFIKELK